MLTGTEWQTPGDVPSHTDHPIRAERRALLQGTTLLHLLTSWGVCMKRFHCLCLCIVSHSHYDFRGNFHSTWLLWPHPAKTSSPTPLWSKVNTVNQWAALLWTCLGDFNECVFLCKLYVKWPFAWIYQRHRVKPLYEWAGFIPSEWQSDYSTFHWATGPNDSLCPPPPLLSSQGSSSTP